MRTFAIGASRVWLGLTAALIAVGLAACQSPGVAFVASSASGARDGASASAAPEPAEPTYIPSSEPLRLGLQHFDLGNYGLAERYFRDAIEKSPRDADAWIGLAASYDRIRRFDLADRAYHAAIRLSGETVQILNNQGYSYLLRGDLSAARAKFRKAYQRDPHNLTIINNIQILNAQQRSHRPPNATKH